MTAEPTPEHAPTALTSTDGSPLRYLVVGAGNRCEMYLRSLLEEHADVAVLVGIGDTNPGRAEYFRAFAAERSAGSVIVFDPTDLEAVVRAERVDRVIVTTPDHTHAQLICRALRAGADVVVEKPLTVDDAGTRAIAHAVEETGRTVVVTFNYRYSPRNTALKEVVQSGRIGRVTSIDFTWMLDTVHGADYFRRWHRLKENSGGLLVHKSSHHFDLVNWWLSDSPERVYASGGLRFYGPDNAAADGRVRHGRAVGSQDPFALDLRTDDRLTRLYLDNEKHDGYRRNQDVFEGEITIEDNLALVVDYAQGATLSYSLNAHCPWEGYRVAVNGTRGRAELDVVERAAVLPASGGSPVDPSVTAGPDHDGARHRGDRLVVQEHWGAAEEITIHTGEGSHGGGDRLLLADVFRGPHDDPFGRPSDYRDGIAAVAVGIAGNRSLETGSPVRVRELDLGPVLSRTVGSRPASEAGSGPDARPTSDAVAGSSESAEVPA
ncbi:Gfo/Idh/MocA family protein [Brevibacterium yomogidense]|uniref:Gfo/Idh/MocA family protein n=1 Tax=Brevibacterium yomogidense TaxID=946573 RepID=UPI0018DEFE7F|nr:Gfo/Idh/MocA family oxidoreductase [Brevibacterium yomogidense]